MPEPQIPGRLRGNPTEGTYAHVQPERRGYTPGPMFSPPPYIPSGNMSVNPVITRQRLQAAGSIRSWHW